MGDVKHSIEEIVRRHDEARVNKEEAQWRVNAAQAPAGSYYARPFSRNEAFLKDDVIQKLVEGYVKALWACKDGRIDKRQMLTSVTSKSWSIWNFSDFKEPITATQPRHEVYVDMGLTLLFQGHAGIRLSGDSNAVNVVNDLAPQFVMALLKDTDHRGATGAIWLEVAALQPGTFEDLCQKYNALLTEIEPEADRVCQKHAKKLEKSRARAARPDVVAKREAEARNRARESLSKLLGHKAKSVLDVWTPEELLTYLKLCQKHEYVLRQLMTWSNQTPLGSKVLELEDVTTAIEMAKVRDVMDS